VFVEISLESGERRISERVGYCASPDVEIDRLEKCRVALYRAINDFLLPDFALPDNFVCATLYAAPSISCAASSRSCLISSRLRA
jgi:hypothetical protein